MNRRLPAVAALLLALCQAAGAETWYRWRAPDGQIQLLRAPPPLGTPYEEVRVPDPVRWSNPPEMPAEIGGEHSESPQDLFRQAAQSVYWLVRPVHDGPLAGDSVVFGSAVAISEDLALTNCHVMLDAGDDAGIGSGDQATPARVELVAADFQADRCVILAHDLPLHPVAGVRRADTLEIGEPVYAIGNPQRFERTLSDGLISGKRQFGEVRMLQTSAAISPGSSGGGLFDSRGNLVGITTSSLKRAQNINFAIPAEDFWK